MPQDFLINKTGMKYYKLLVCYCCLILILFYIKLIKNRIMKNFYFMLICLLSIGAMGQNVTITKVIETNCSSPFVKTVELYVDGTVDFANDDVVLNYMQNGDPWADNQIDISGLGVQTDSFVYIVRDIPLMQAEFPSTTFDSSNTVEVGTSTNGDDGYQVVLNGIVVSQFGETETDGTGEAWEHGDAVATRLDGIADTGNFDVSHWDITAGDSVDNETACQGGNGLEAYFASLGGTFPLGSGSGWTPSCSTFLGDYDVSCDSVNPGNTDDTYTATLDYTGAATGETFTVSTTPSGFSIGGDDPTSVADGSISVSGITEGTDITISVNNTADGGVCDLSRDLTSPVCVPVGSAGLEFVGVIDFDTPEGGSSGKAIHVVATEDIADLSIFGLGVANNAGGSDGEEYTFPAQSASNGDHILLPRDEVAMENYLTTPGLNLFDLVIESGAATGNGNDAVELFKNGTVVETFGDINDDDSAGNGWDYGDSWAFKDTAGASWPAGWIYGPADCTDGATTIFDSPCVYPFVESLSNTEFSEVELNIYPNPVNDGFVNINSKIDGQKSIELYNLNGKNVMSTTLDDNTLNVSEVSSGVYLLKVTISNNTSTKKLIIK